eukprot:3940635-Rhodomonas_salina.2
MCIRDRSLSSSPPSLSPSSPSLPPLLPSLPRILNPNPRQLPPPQPTQALERALTRARAGRAGIKSRLWCAVSWQRRSVRR